MVGWMRKVGLACLALMFGVCALPGVLWAQVTLPATGVDVDGYITALITDLGPIVAVVLGGFLAFLLIRFGMKWARRTA